MAHETEQRVYRQDARPAGSPQGWVTDYYEALGEAGWHFEVVNTAYVAAQDASTPELQAKWQETQQPIEMSIVIVPPHDELGSLPLRSLSYAVTALSYSNSLRKRDQIPVTTLRVITPVHANIYANGGNTHEQIVKGESMRRLIEATKDEYFPELSEMNVVMDVGRPITDAVEEQLRERVELVQKNHPNVVSSFAAAADRYDRNGTAPHRLTLPQRSIAYLLAHPAAWGLSNDDTLFAQRELDTLNFMPASELRFLKAMREIEGTGWTRTERGVGIVISAKQTKAPYYPAWEGIPGIPEEPTLADVTKPGAEQSYANLLRPQSGRREVAEVVANINALKSAVEQEAGRRRRLNIREKPLPLATLIAQNM